MLCLRFINGMLDWGVERPDQVPLTKTEYQRLDSLSRSTTSKTKQPEAAITIHTIQPCEKLRREEESDIPYTEESDVDIEYLCPIQRVINPKENLGKLYFSLQYFPRIKLLVKLLRADELPEARKNLPTVYVTSSILPCSTAKNQELKSTIQKGSCCPIFNDNFEFDVSEININGKHLRFVVWYVDNFSQGECLGVVEQNLSLLKNTQIPSDMDTETVICRDIQRISQEFQDFNENRLQGVLLCSVTYIPTTNRLTVVLFKAQNINLVSDDNQGVYAEVTIVHVKRNKRKRKVTSSMVGTNNPVYNEAILFDLGDLDIENIKLQITLKQKRIDKPDKAIGQVLMGSDVYDSIAKLHWYNAINANKPVAQWHNLRRCQSFNTAIRRRLRSRLSNSENEELLLTDSSSSDD